MRRAVLRLTQALLLSLAVLASTFLLARTTTWVWLSYSVWRIQRIDLNDDMADMLFIDSMHDGTRDMFSASVANVVNPILIVLQLFIVSHLVKGGRLKQGQVAVLSVANAVILLFAFGPYNEPYIWGWQGMVIPILLCLLYLTVYLGSNCQHYEEE